MARPPRKDYPGAWHHVMHRGARRERIFRDDRDATLFFDVLHEAVEGFRIEVHAYSLMPNHYHLLVRSPHATLSRAMRHVNHVFTQRLNRRERWDGPVFRGRFASQLVDSESHLDVLVAYIHLNPVRAHLVARPDDECWTSHRAYLGQEKAPPWLTLDEVLPRFGGPDELRRYVLDIHKGAKAWPDTFSLERGWFAPGEAPAKHASEARPANEVVDPETVLQRVQQVSRSSRDEILLPVKGPRANPARRFAVWALRRSTLLSHARIGALMGMTAPHVAALLRRSERSPGEPLLTWMREWDAQDWSDDGA